MVPFWLTPLCPWINRRGPPVRVTDVAARPQPQAQTINCWGIAEVPSVVPCPRMYQHRGGLCISIVPQMGAPDDHGCHQRPDDPGARGGY